MNNGRDNVVCPACGKILGNSPGARGMLSMHMRSPGRKYRAAHRRLHIRGGGLSHTQAAGSPLDHLPCSSTRKEKPLR